MKPHQLIGRPTSHFTRVVRIFAHALEVPYELRQVTDMTRLDAASYADNPALKVPSLERDGALLFGSQNLCRALAELRPDKRVVWPEMLSDDLSRNAFELVWHGMNAQVQLVFGLQVSGLPADNLFFVKARQGFESSLGWLESRLDSILSALPPRDLSLIEVALFCLVEHIAFRKTLPLDPYPRLRAFARQFAASPAAIATPYPSSPPTPPKVE